MTYVAAMRTAGRLHPTNINLKVVPQIVETPNGPVLPSASERVLFADSTPSNGDDLTRFVPLNAPEPPDVWWNGQGRECLLPRRTYGV